MKNRKSDDKYWIFRKRFIERAITPDEQRTAVDQENEEVDTEGRALDANSENISIGKRKISTLT